MPDVVFYSERDGMEPVLEYMSVLAARKRSGENAAMLRYIELLRDKGNLLGDPYSRLIDVDNRIFELRPGNHRIAYATHDDRYVLLHAWRKKGQALSKRDLRTAVRRLRDWQERSGEAGR